MNIFKIILKFFSNVVPYNFYITVFFENAVELNIQFVDSWRTGRVETKQLQLQISLLEPPAMVIHYQFTYGFEEDPPGPVRSAKNEITRVERST